MAHELGAAGRAHACRQAGRHLRDRLHDLGDGLCCAMLLAFVAAFVVMALESLEHLPPMR